MSLKSKLRKTLLYLLLGAGSAMGLPINPKEIEDLLYAMNQTRIEVTITDEKDEPK